MPWMKKKEEPVIQKPMEIVSEDKDEFEDLENQERELNERIKKLEAKKLEASKPKQEEPANQISKQEVIDMIEGNLVRITQLVEVLRRL